MDWETMFAEWRERCMDRGGKVIERGMGWHCASGEGSTRSVMDAETRALIERERARYAAEDRHEE